MAITREQARAELARRELSRRESMQKEKPQTESIATQGLGYLKEHPFRANFEPAAKTITGKSLEEYGNEIAQNPSMGQSAERPFDKNLGVVKPAAMGLAMAGQIGDMITTPATYELGPALKVAGLIGGKILSPITKPIGKYMQESKAVKEGLAKIENVFTKPYGLPKDSLVRKIEETQKQAVDKLRADKKILDKSMFQESDRAAIDIQERLPEYFKRNSTTYGNTLDTISDDLVKSNNQITRGELSSIYDDVLRESQDDLLASGKPMQELEYLSKKYDLSPVKSEAGLLDDSGKALNVAPDPNEPIDFKQVVEDVKAIRKSLSSKAKAGERYSPEDVVAAKFAKRWGDYLETKVPTFKELNEEYAPIIETMKTAGKYFKPYSQGTDKLQGVSFLKQIAQDKLQSSEKKLLDILENGTTNFPGIGKRTVGLENIKNLQGKVSKDIDDTIREYGTQKKLAQDLLDKEKALKEKRNAVLGLLTGTGLLTGAGAYVVKKVAGVN